MFSSDDDRQPTEPESAIAHYCEAIEQDAARELADEREALDARPLWRGPCERCGMRGSSLMGTSCPRCGAAS
jgi:rubrerythrin